MNRFIDNIFLGNSLNMLKRLPSESIDAVIADPMYIQPEALENAQSSSTANGYTEQKTEDA
jgi:DNA modification methylase